MATWYVEDYRKDYLQRLAKGEVEEIETLGIAWQDQNEVKLEAIQKLMERFKEHAEKILEGKQAPNYLRDLEALVEKIRDFDDDDFYQMIDIFNNLGVSEEQAASNLLTQIEIMKLRIEEKDYLGLANATASAIHWADIAKIPFSANNAKLKKKNQDPKFELDVCIEAKKFLQSHNYNQTELAAEVAIALDLKTSNEQEKVRNILKKYKIPSRS